VCDAATTIDCRKDFEFIGKSKCLATIYTITKDSQDRDTDFHKMRPKLLKPKTARMRVSWILKTKRRVLDSVCGCYLSTLKAM